MDSILCLYMIKTIQSSDLRNNFKDALAHVKKTQEPLIITERGVPTSVIVDIDAYEDYISSRNPKLIASVKKSRGERKSGDVFSFTDVFGSIE